MLKMCKQQKVNLFTELSFYVFSLWEFESRICTNILGQIEGEWLSVLMANRMNELVMDCDEDD